MSTHGLRDTQPSYSDAFAQNSDLPCCSESRSIVDWLENVLEAHDWSEKGRADAALRHSRATYHTATSYLTAGIQTRMMRDNERTNTRVTRSRSRRQLITDEIVSAEVNVAALHIAEGSEGERNMEDIDDSCFAKNPPSELPVLKRRDLTVLPSATSTHRWMSADSQSRSSRSFRTPLDTESVTTETTVTSSSSRKVMSRSKSPVKSMVDLSLLDRRVKRMHLEKKDYPDTIQQLVRQVENIRRGKGVIPHEIRSDVEERVEAEDWWWSQTPSALPSKEKILMELEIMEEIRDKTHKLQDSDAAEPRWNSDVHFMMLRQVCMHLPGIQQQNITSARPNPHLVPKTGFNNTESKLVDHALVCDESLIPSHLVQQVLADSRNGIDSINHTSASVQSLRQDPIAVSIETKTPNGSESTALAQLSLWAATHFNRLRTLLRPTKRDVVLMPLPLIMSVGGRYSLFFAIDGAIAEGITIAGGETAFGDCATLDGCYQVLAGVRAVGIWVKEVWVPWFVSECLDAQIQH
ncbi:hypothetical protein ACJQWK_02536 [Exserohilum turcicum]